MMPFTVIGAGMAGLLASGILRNSCDAIVEAEPSLPNNHSALLRFRTNAVADALGITFKKVRVIRSSHPWRNPTADALAYSMKVLGALDSRSIITADSSVVERYIAPPNLVQMMAARSGAPIIYDAPVSLKDGKLFARGITISPPVISTIPMPVLAAMLGYRDKNDDISFTSRFRFVQGINITADILNADVYATVYVPDPDFWAYRVSITGSRLIVEASCAEVPDEDLPKEEQRAAKDSQQILDKALWYLGLRKPRNSVFNIQVHRQRYAKIAPIDETARKRFIIWATETHGIYSLGRFATWRPGLLLDDVVNDVRVISRMHSSTPYDWRK
jgi:hypothetical protein